MKVNRFYIVFVIWAALLSWCIFNNNTHFNAPVLYFGFLSLVVALAYIYENKNEKEKKFIEKLINIF